MHPVVIILDTLWASTRNLLNNSLKCIKYGTCAKYETCATLHMFSILYISQGCESTNDMHLKKVIFLHIKIESFGEVIMNSPTLHV